MSLCKWGFDIQAGMKDKIQLCKEEATYHGFCEEHIPYLEKRERDYNNTPLELRQKYLDALRDGKTIGEAREVAGIDFEVALEITNRAIKSYSYMSYEAQP